MPLLKPLSHQQLAELRQKLVDHFGEEELRALCFDLDIGYDDLPTERRDHKVAELIRFLARRDRIPELIEKCVKLRPQANWSSRQATVFISCEPGPGPAQELAKFLKKFLKARKHLVYPQASGRGSKSWQARMKEIGASDYVIVLLTEDLAHSDRGTVFTQVKRASEFRERKKRPDTLLVCVTYDGLLPLWLHPYVNPRAYMPWQAEADNERVGIEILAAIQSGRLPDRAPLEASPSTGETVTEDGTETVTKTKLIQRPRAHFDWRRLDLENPNQVVKLEGRFYVRREADDDLDRQVEHPGTITTIRAPRQTGKSSLLVRGVHHALETGARVVMFDLQMVDKLHLESFESFLRVMAESIMLRLGLDPNRVTNLWDGKLASQNKLTYLVGNYILPASENRLVLAMDEVDRLLTTPIRNDFFSMLRAWCNNAAYQEPWDKFSIVMATATDPWLFIRDARQSPFNVGLKLHLEDFSKRQVRYLNQLHGSPVGEKDLPEFMDLLNGHPYLTRQALYTLVRDKLTWNDLDAVATSDEGPFGEHLRYYYGLLHDQPKLQKALEQIINHNSCPDEDALYRLVRAGLVKGIVTACECRCELYRRYFKDKLR